MTRLRLRGALVRLTGLLLVLGSCSNASEGAQPVATCTLPSTIATPADVPADFPWLDDVALTSAELTKKFVSMEGFSERTVEELFDSVRPVVIANGFDILNTDFEGFEAEIYFAKGNSLAGIVSLRRAICDGYVKVNVIYDPLETAAGRKAVRDTRELSGDG